MSIFGILNYDFKSDEFSIDNPIAFLTNANKDTLVESIESDKFWEGVKIAGRTVLAVLLFAGTIKLANTCYKRWRELQTKNKVAELEKLDKENQLEGAPPKTRQISIKGNKFDKST